MPLMPPTHPRTLPRLGDPYRAAWPTPRAMPPRQRGGFTLLELLVVLFILGLLAVSALSLTGGLDRQVRLDSTRQRLTMLRSATVGHAGGVDATDRRLSGYVVDIGTLPAAISDLTDEPAEEERLFAVRPPMFDPTPDADGRNDGSGDEIELDEPGERLGKGWRGPYVRPSPSAGPPRYRDGWGNVADDAAADADNHGWAVTFDDPQSPQRMTITSHGADGIADNDGGGDDDYEADVTMTLEPADWTVPIDGWSVTVSNRSGAPVSNLRAGLLVYRDGSWQRLTTDQKVTVAPDASAELTFSFTPQEITDGEHLAPIGEHLLVLIEDADAVVGNGETPYPSPGTVGGERVSQRVKALPRASLPEVVLTVTD